MISGKLYTLKKQKYKSGAWSAPQKVPSDQRYAFAVGNIKNQHLWGHCSFGVNPGAGYAVVEAEKTILMYIDQVPYPGEPNYCLDRFLTLEGQIIFLNNGWRLGRVTSNY